MNNELNKGVDREEDVAIKDKLREHKGEEVVEVDKEIEVEDDGWKDGNWSMYLVLIMDMTNEIVWVGVIC